MKSIVMGLAVLAFAAFAPSVEADHDQDRCTFCVKVSDKVEWKRQKVCTTERVLVCYKNVLVRYEDCWEKRTVTEYRTQTTYRRVLVGYDACGYPVYRSKPVCRQVPVQVTKWVRVRKPIYKKQPVYENREVYRWKWGRVRTPVYRCFRFDY